MTGSTALARAAAPSGERPLVSLRGVGKVFANGVVALANLDLDIRAGEFVSLLGPSGCGKSTALRLIAGLGEPTAGEVVWPASATADHTGDIGFVFQDATLMPWATVADNVWLPLRLRGVARPAAAARVSDCLALVGLSAFGNAYPRELSGGMRMRASIARALVTRPSLLLMDEPFGALDEITRQKLNDDLLHLSADIGSTIVFVTHSVYESIYLSSRVVVMAARPGRIIGEIAVEAPRLRDGFRETPAYADLCRRASALLLGALAPDAHL